MSHAPRHFWIGLALVAVVWPANWLIEGPRTHLLFFPLWTGYVLLVDGVVLLRTRTSILRRSPRTFLLLFLVSIPTWWLFEALNVRLHNWTYLGRELFTDLEFALLASIAFSTVVPAVFETAELWRSFHWTERLARLRPESVSRRTVIAWTLSGTLMIALLLALPDVAYPLTWLSLVLLIDPIAWRLRRGSILDHLAHGDWQRIVTLALGALTCGFFWELWNAWSYPKWTYRVPGLDVLHVFEMPLPGYLGYLPFALELESVAHLLLGAGMKVVCDTRLTNGSSPPVDDDATEESQATRTRDPNPPPLSSRQHSTDVAGAPLKKTSQRHILRTFPRTEER